MNEKCSWCDGTGKKICCDSKICEHNNDCEYCNGSGIEQGV